LSVDEREKKRNFMSGTAIYPGMGTDLESVLAYAHGLNRIIVIDPLYGYQDYGGTQEEMFTRWVLDLLNMRDLKNPIRNWALVSFLWHEDFGHLEIKWKGVFITLELHIMIFEHYDLSLLPPFRHFFNIGMPLVVSEEDRELLDQRALKNANLYMDATGTDTWGFSRKDLHNTLEKDCQHRPTWRTTVWELPFRRDQRHLWKPLEPRKKRSKVVVEGDSSKAVNSE
jgi:hypothetical protein